MNRYHSFTQDIIIESLLCAKAYANCRDIGESEAVPDLKELTVQ